MTKFKATLLATALLAAAPIASAATATAPTNMRVSIEIVNSCSIATNDLDFGSPSSLAADIDADTSVSVSCTSLGPISVGLSVGGGTGATVASRKMTNGAATIDYSLFSDSTRLVPIGDVGADRIGGSSTGAPQVFNIYGRVFGGQGAKPTGIYADSVVATVEY